MKNLLGIFIIGALYLVAAYHLTNLYFAHQSGFEHFILVDGGIYPQLFWWGYVVLGNLLPLLLIYLSRFGQDQSVIDGFAAGDSGRLRAAVCVHHRRAGISAEHFPRL